MSDEKQKYTSSYLGDAVYASFDGLMIGLSLNDHRNKPVIFLEPEVFEALVKYASQFYHIPKTEEL